jgi:hypothetical protein
MKFYYLNWDNYSFHEIEGHYTDKKVSPYSNNDRRCCKYAKLDGIERPVPIDFHHFVEFSPNYRTNLEVLKNQTIQWVKDRILYHEYHIKYYQSELDVVKDSLKCFEVKTKHLFETT